MDTLIEPKIIVIPPPFNLQREIEFDEHRFRVIACGRRWGKTFLAIRETFRTILERWKWSKVRQRAWVVAPTFPLVREDWLTAEVILKDVVTDKKESKMLMEFLPYGTIEFKSAEREDEGLRGAGIDCAVVDEASRVSRKSWEQGLRPALADKLGKCIFISTPKGRNWFYELYLKGQTPNDEIKSWQHPTFTNPYFPKEEWETILNNTPELILRQEYYADFLEDESTVFKNLSKCLRGNFEAGNDNERYTVGIDLGKTEDFTVISVIKNSSAQLVYLKRMNKCDWSLQKKQIRAVSNQYRQNIVYIDSTGLGDPIEEDLRQAGIATRSYKFTPQSKQELIEQLIVAIEQGLIGIPDCQDTKFLLDELKAFTYEMLPSGRIRYSAPEGLHDDGVISLGLAVKGIQYYLYKKQEEKKGNLPMYSPAWIERQMLEKELERNSRIPRRLRRIINTQLAFS